MKLKHEVFWFTKKRPVMRRLEGNVSTEVVIVGGGMAGLMCALRLHRLGRKVAIVERSFCGSGASGRSSGFITPDSEMALSVLLKCRGPDEAKRIWEFVADGVAQIRSVINDFALACDYIEQDSLFVANRAHGFAQVEREHDARLKLGYASRLYTIDHMRDVLGTDVYHGGVRYGGTYAMNSFLFCQELRVILEAVGVKMYENTLAYHAERGRVDTPWGKICAEHVIVCADRWLPKLRIAKPHVYSAQTFLLLSKPLTDAQVASIFPTGACLTWDTDLVYHYFRLTGDKRLLVGGSNLLYTHLPWMERRPAPVEHMLQAYVRKRFPNIDFEFEYFWPGLLGVSKDFLPIAGESREKPGVHFVAAATGLPWAAALGTYMAEKIVGSRSDFDTAFSPDRPFPVGSGLQKLLSKPLSFAISQGIVKLR